MADAPWRCSQCGTVNEPNANACRSCGRWPSLFDLERSAVGEELEQPAVEDVYRHEEYRHDAPAPQELEVPVEPVETDYPGTPGEVDWPGPEDPLERPMQGWPQRLASLIVPIAFLIYIVISIIANR